MKRKIKVYLIVGLAFAVGACSFSSKKNIQESNTLSKKDVLAALVKVNSKWQTEHNVLTQNAFWHPSAYHIGNIAAYQLTKNQHYLSYTLKWAENNQWMGAKSTQPEEWKYTYGETDDYVLFGDWQACFQVYADLYQLSPDEHKVARAKEVMQYQMNTDRNDYWWWADGLFMVMPVMTRMYKVTNDTLYLSKLHDYFSYTRNLIFDEASGLFYRDAKYVFPEHTTHTGKKDFWARGNGWVFAALARVLVDLPKSHVHYSEYVDVFTKMAAALKESQQNEGYWTRSMFDAEQAPGPETSGTAFFLYGMLWGINNGILEEEIYLPVVENSWNYISGTALQSDGSLGYVQPIGEKAIPGQIIDVHSTSDFGVGAFLLAATELVKFLDKQEVTELNNGI